MQRKFGSSSNGASGARNGTSDQQWWVFFADLLTDKTLDDYHLVCAWLGVWINGEGGFMYSFTNYEIDLIFLRGNQKR